MPIAPLCVVDVVGLTPAHLGEHTPRLTTLANAGASAPLAGVTPAVTCTAQASMLTGVPPAGHGIVANGWLYRDTMEIRLWQQSNRLLQAEPLYVTARRRAARLDEEFRCAKLFWWFNQGAAVDWSLTPKPHYGSDGSKLFGVHGWPDAFASEMEREIGDFPFHTFWGPMAGLPCSEWIAAASAATLRGHRPELTLVYLPHLDYDLQRFGPDHAGTPARLREVDACAGTVIDAAHEIGAEVLVVSEYGLRPVSRAVHINRMLREEGLLVIRDGPFGELLDCFNSRAFAVCDHQLAHVYVADPADVDELAHKCAALDGVSEALVGESRADLGLGHPRSGEIVLLSEPDSWFAYPYWLDDRRRPDFANTVDIHRKPGYDPCELMMDPHLPAPKLRAGWRLLQKKMGFRYRMDVIGTDTSVVRGSHGVLPDDPRDGAVVIGADPHLRERALRMVDIKDYALERMGLA